MPLSNADERRRAFRIALKRTNKIQKRRMKHAAAFLGTMPPIPVTPTGETRRWVEAETRKSFVLARALCREDVSDLHVYNLRFDVKFERLMERNPEMDPFEAWSRTLPDGN